MLKKEDLLYLPFLSALDIRAHPHPTPNFLPFLLFYKIATQTIVHKLFRTSKTRRLQQAPVNLINFPEKVCSVLSPKAGRVGWLVGLLLPPPTAKPPPGFVTGGAYSRPFFFQGPN
jgi:hypothetical protein